MGEEEAPEPPVFPALELKFFMKKINLILGLAVLLAFSAGRTGQALDAGGIFTVTLARVNSNGTTTDIASTTATSGSDGKITFTFDTTVVPTVDEANFLSITIKNSSNAVVRQSLVPAPPADGTSNVGANSLSDVQAKAILDGFASSGTDDPIYGAFGFMLLRSSQLSAADRKNITAGGKNAILGTGGFNDFLQTSGGVTAAQLATFRKKIVSNTTSGTKDLADYCSNFKTAVDNNDPDSMAKAGGFIADIFIDAANAAGFDVGLIPSALDAAGQIADADPNIADLSDSAELSTQQALSSFFQRIAAIKVNKEYTEALTTLGATGSQVDRYNTAVNTMLSAFESIDTQYRQDYENQTMDSTKQAAINALFQAAFNSFETNIASTDAEIATMKTNFAAALGINEGDLPGDFGKFRNELGTQVNWPIPMTVLHNWATTVLNAGGSLTYTRDTLAVPAMMEWLNGSRTNFDGPTTMSALLGLREDSDIIQFTFFTIFNGGNPGREAEKSAKLLMQQRIDTAKDRLSGTTKASTAITAAQKKALVKLMLQPNFE